MHRHRSLLLASVMTAVVLSTSPVFVQKSFAQDNNAEVTPVLLDEPLLVEVESNNLVPGGTTSTMSLIPYKMRRERWGHNIQLSYTSILFDNYEPFLAPDFFEDPSGLIELAYGYRYNFFLGSLAAELGAGFWSGSVNGMELSLQQYRIGGRFSLDNLFDEPWVAPYVGGGAYLVVYEETFANDSSGGNTTPAPYYYVGALFQMNWLDKTAALDAYLDGGVENASFFIEARKYVASSEELDPDFSTDFSVSGGLALEF